MLEKISRFFGIEAVVSRFCRVVVTGGPGGGKTTAADLFRRELGERIVIVPEAATILYTGGFPRTDDRDVRKSTQKAIYFVQRFLEDAQAAHYQNRILVCDRGTVDGAAYWPDDGDDFFHNLNTSLSAELKRYDAVLFFETAAVGGISIEGGNPTRIETQEQAKNINQKLKDLWSQHPKFVFIPHDASFMKKINVALSHLLKIVNELSAELALPEIKTEIYLPNTNDTNSSS